MKKKISGCLLALAGIFSTQAIIAQQIPLTSQYMFNKLVVNPAVAGTGDGLVTRLVNRNQWVGIDGAPVTQTFSMHGLIESLNLGLGGYVFRDQVGPFTQLGAQLAAAYHIRITEDAQLSLALQGGAQQYTIDVTQLKPSQQNDAVLAGKQPIVTNVPDATFGAYFYTPQYYIGVSVPHIIAGRVNTGDLQVTDLKRHYLLMAGTYFNMSDEFRVEPSILGRYIAGNLSVDISAKLFYQNMIWIGASYRPQDAFVVLLGVKVFNRLYFGYSYDITTSDLSAISKGTHEIMLGINIHGKTKNRRPADDTPSFE